MARIVYKTKVSVTSATLAGLGEGLVTGHRRDEGGKVYVLVKNGTAASATIADGAACKLVAGVATVGVTADVKVIVTASAVGAECCFCVNNTGAAVPGDAYFWGLQIGRGYGLAGGALDTDGLEIMAVAAGNIAVLAGATAASSGVAISDLAAAGVSNAIWWALPSKRPQV